MEEKSAFRDFGLAPVNLAPLDGPVRAYFPWYHVCAQFAGTGCFTVLALGLAAAFAFGVPFPYGLPLVPLPLVGVGLLIYFVTRHDSAWIELDGDTLRARHLYTRRVVVRRIEEVKDLLTHVLPGCNWTAALVNAWLGRIRAVEVRFNDDTSPMKICRTDPAMKGAQELIEAILYRMSQHGPVDYDVVLDDGKPLVKRVFWARDKVEVGPLLRDLFARKEAAQAGEPSTAISPPETPRPAPPPTVQSQPPPPPRSS